MTTSDEPRSGELSAPVRNRYFYGKLLGERQLCLEQDYLRGKLQRLGLAGIGSGVLAGLELSPATDGTSLVIGGGLAIDGLGREIIVPDGIVIEDLPFAAGDSDTDPVDTVTVELFYHECDVEPVPVIVADCDTAESCTAGATRERFRIRLNPGRPAQGPSTVTGEQCLAIFGDALEPTDPRAVARDELDHLWTGDPDRPVVLGVAIRTDDGLVVDLDDRVEIYSNRRLWDLLLCLAERVDRRSVERWLSYRRGDGQQGLTGQALVEPLEVEAIEADRATGESVPLAEASVTFRVRSGGGSLSRGGQTGNEIEVPTGANGRAGVSWTVGSTVGLQRVEATLGSSVIEFSATTTEAEVADPPVIDVVEPPNAEVIDPNDPDPARAQAARRWLERPRFGFTVSRALDERHLEEFKPWLRVTRLMLSTDPAQILTLEALEPSLAEVERTAAGFEVRYDLNTEFGRGFRTMACLVQMRPNGIPLAEAEPRDELAAGFAGTNIAAATLDEIFAMDVGDSQAITDTTLQQRLLRGLRRQGELPTRPGADYHGWFAVNIEGGQR